MQALPLPGAMALERAIEGMLALDPETRERLAALDGKTLRVELAAPRLDIVLVVVDGRIAVPAEHDGEVDLVISGSLAALRSLAGSTGALYRGEVRIVGDLAVGKALRALLAGFDPDWQGALAPVLGDALTHRLDRGLRASARWWPRTREAFGENLRDWLEDEVALVATPEEVSRFNGEVDDLRAAVDRFEARLERLEREGLGREPSAS